MKWKEKKKPKAGLSNALINASTSTALRWKAEDLYGTLSNMLSQDLTLGPSALGASRDEAQSAIHIIRNQTPDLAARGKWKRKDGIHCLVIKTHFIRPPLLPRTSLLAIDRLLSAKWAQSDSKYMRHTYLTFSARRRKSRKQDGTRRNWPTKLSGFVAICDKKNVASVCFLLLRW